MQTMVDRDPLAFLPLVIFGVVGLILVWASVENLIRKPSRGAVLATAACCLLLGSSLYGLLVGSGGIVALFWAGVILTIPLTMTVQGMREDWRRSHGVGRLLFLGAVALAVTATGAVAAWAVPSISRGETNLLGIGAIVFYMLFAVSFLLGAFRLWDTWRDWRGPVTGVTGVLMCIAMIVATLSGFSGRSIRLLIAAFSLVFILGALHNHRQTMPGTYWRRPFNLRLFTGYTLAESLFGWEGEMKLRQIGAILLIALAVLITLGLFTWAIATYISVP